MDTAGAAAQLRLAALRRGVPIEQIARLVGHARGSTVTETAYRKQLRPAIDEGATVMDRVFGVRRAATPRPQPPVRGPQLG
jgi:hypothetical protein